jgi:hypothetical protein
MSDYKISIERVDNGYILELPPTYEDEEGNEGEARREVISEDDSKWGNLEAGLLLLNRVMEFFDLIGSKHDERRLRVSLSGPGEEE